ncbi:hypothetical protein CerSpe_075460 [Prunus speciosa]
MVPPKLWKLLWKIQAPPKIKNFMWRALRNCLATSENLFKRKIGRSPLCQICSTHPESVEHILLLCPWVQGVWFGGNLNYRINHLEITSLWHWLHDILLSYSNRIDDQNWLATQIVFTCWNIWKSRCKAIFEHKTPSPHSTITATRVGINNFMEAVKLSRSPHITANERTSTSPICWNPPNVGIIKVNVDASWNHNNCRAGIGVILRDSCCNFIAAKAIPSTASSALEAEAQAVLHGCELAHALACTSVIIESDSRGIIQCLNGDIARGAWAIYPILNRIREQQTLFHSCRWSWISRVANEAADLVASLAMARMSNEVWVHRPPSSLTHVLNKDGLPCPPHV